MYRIFLDLLHRSPAFPWHSRLFPTISVFSMTISVRSISLRCLSDCSVIHPFRVFRLFPSISLFQLVSFQFSILGSDRISPFDPFTFLFSHNHVSHWSPGVIVLWSYDLHFPFKLWSVSYCFCSVYKSGKLCSYSLACNRTKPSVTWPLINPNTQSLSVSMLAS